jgi:hypothetical protein
VGDWHNRLLHRPVDGGTAKDAGFFFQHGQVWRNWVIRNNTFEVAVHNGSPGDAPGSCINFNGDFITTENIYFRGNKVRLIDGLSSMQDVRALYMYGVKGVTFEDNEFWQFNISNAIDETYSDNTYGAIPNLPGFTAHDNLNHAGGTYDLPSYP